jgi:hypothetical protein
MLKINSWEAFLINAVILFLQELEGKLSNPVEVAALQSAISFLQSLVAGSVSVK